MRALVLMLLCPAAPASAWGCYGHQTIALIAQQHLSAHARRMVGDLLAHYTVGSRLRRLCRPSGLDAMADLSTWADDVRKDRQSPYYGTGPWHFIDIPRTASPGTRQSFCPRRSGCLLSALNDQLAVLRAGGAPRRRAAEALLLVIHLIGDLHQPLHCTTNNDLGANCLPVAYFGREPRRSPEHHDRYQPNLHAVWDTDIIQRIVEDHGPAWFAEFLQRRFESQVTLWEKAPIDLTAWTWESHRVANETAYGQLPQPIPAEKPSRVSECGPMSERMFALRERLGKGYQRAATPAVELQLAKAGIRLAMVLNQLWP